MKTDLDGATIDQLWALHLAISKTLSEKIMPRRTCLKGAFRRLSLRLVESLNRERPNADHIHPSFPSFSIPKIRHKPGPVVASSRAG